MRRIDCILFADDARVRPVCFAPLLMAKHVSLEERQRKTVRTASGWTAGRLSPDEGLLLQRDEFLN